ncbi:MAG: MFS transporter, partial [Thermoactinospora sp.]|nr:MFS transporter [Thermoactinospora sp.]
IAGTIVGPATGGTAFTQAGRGVWWLVLGLGLGVLVVAPLSTRRRAPAVEPDPQPARQG